jgi:hypothetical protein
MTVRAYSVRKLLQATDNIRKITRLVGPSPESFFDYWHLVDNPGCNPQPSGVYTLHILDAPVQVRVVLLQSLGATLRGIHAFDLSVANQHEKTPTFRLGF